MQTSSWFLLFLSLPAIKTHQEKSVLNYKEQQVLFAKLAKDPLFIDYIDATWELTFSFSKTRRDGEKVDSIKMKDNSEKDFVKKLTNAGVVNAEQIKDLSNKQVGLMRQLMDKYPGIRKVPISDRNTFFQSQHAPRAKEKMSAKQN